MCPNVFSSLKNGSYYSNERGDGAYTAQNYVLSNSFEHQWKHDDISEACNKSDKKKKMGWSVIMSIRISFFSLFLEVDATVCHVFLCDICVKVGIQLKTEIFKK